MSGVSVGVVLALGGCFLTFPPPGPVSSPAGIHVVFADAASEEALAAVAAGRPVVFARGSVSTDGAQTTCPQVA